MGNNPLNLPIEGPLATADAERPGISGSPSKPRGIMRLWYAEPVPPEYLGELSLVSARMVWALAFLGYSAVHLMGLGGPGGIYFHVGVLLWLLLLSVGSIPVRGDLRLALVAATLVALGALQNYLRGDPLYSLFTMSPVATLLLVGFGSRVALVGLLIVTGIISLQAADYDAAALTRFAVQLPSGFLWSAMVTAFVAMLLNKIQWERNEAQQSLAQEKRTTAMIGDQIRVPAAVLAALTEKPDIEAADLKIMAESAEQMVAIFESLSGYDDGRSLRAPIVGEVSVEALARQVRSQLLPQHERLGMELHVDVHPSANVLVRTDRFMVRTIMINLIRAATSFSDGHRIWMNVRCEAGVVEGAGLVFEIEDNGHLPQSGWLDICQPAAPEEMSLTLDGMGLARSWTQRLGGTFITDRSPRGGRLFKVTLPLQNSMEDRETGLFLDDAMAVKTVRTK